MKAEVQGMIDGNAVLVLATSTCPFCIEVRLVRDVFGRRYVLLR